MKSNGNKRKKLPSVSSLERKFWNEFSLYIRKRDGPICWTCGSLPTQVAGHVISQRRRATRYHENNCHSQCRNCNRRDYREAGYHDFCVSVFIKKMGPSAYVDLVEKSRLVVPNNSVPYMREFYKLGIEKYRFKREQLDNAG